MASDINIISKKKMIIMPFYSLLSQHSDRYILNLVSSTTIYLRIVRMHHLMVNFAIKCATFKTCTLGRYCY